MSCAGVSTSSSLSPSESPAVPGPSLPAAAIPPTAAAPPPRAGAHARLLSGGKRQL